MKKKTTYLTSVLLAGLLFGCDTTFNVEDKAPGVFSVATEGFNTIKSYAIEEPYQCELWVSRGGLELLSGTVQFVPDQLLLDSLNAANGTSYKYLPDDCYELSQLNVTLSKNDSRAKGYITYYPDKIVKLTGFDNIQYVLPLRLTSAELPLNPARNALLLGFTVSEPTVMILNQDAQSISIEGDKIPTLPVNIGVEFNNKWDIKCNLTINPALVDDYNTRKKTYFTLLPEEMYTAPSDIKLEAGSTSVKPVYTLIKEKLQPGNYILPIQMSSIESSLNGDPTDVIKMDKEGSLLYCISKLGDKVPKKDWSILSFTTEEPAGEGANNGRAYNLIDDDTKTYWHSKWQGGNTPLPYQITIDMKKTTLISQIELLPRGQGSTNPLKVVQFEASTDNVNWEFIGEFNFENIDTPLLYATKTTKARYLRMLIPDKGGNTIVCAIRELNVRGITQ